MNFKGLEICCPACRSDLHRPAEDALVCDQCQKRYPIIFDIPDLRLHPDPYIGFEEELAKVEKLVARFHEFDFESFVDFYYSITSVVPAQHARQYKRSLIAGVARAEGWLAQWETQAGLTQSGGSLLEIGCGTGPLLVAARKFRLCAGVDIAMRWLVVAKKRLEQEKLDLPLVCACSESLPFREQQFSRVVFDSAIEHLRDQAVSLREAHRVIKSDGAVFVATPNRRGIGPDPQTGIPCGSFLPEKLTAALVRRAGGVPPKRRLLSAGELRRLLQGAGFSAIRLFLPEISVRQRSHFSGMMRMAIDAYELARTLPLSRQLLFACGPLLLATARKQGSA